MKRRPARFSCTGRGRCGDQQAVRCVSAIPMGKKDPSSSRATPAKVSTCFWP